jgi:hypothetical protein
MTPVGRALSWAVARDVREVPATARVLLDGYPPSATRMIVFPETRRSRANAEVT